MKSPLIDIYFNDGVLTVNLSKILSMRYYKDKQTIYFYYNSFNSQVDCISQSHYEDIHKAYYDYYKTTDDK